MSYSKKRRKLALSPRSLTESSAESELSRLDAHCDGLCGLVLITSNENYEKEGCETWSSFALLAVTMFLFFWGKLIWSYCRLSLNVSRISKTKPTPLSVFRLSDERARTRSESTFLHVISVIWLLLQCAAARCIKQTPWSSADHALAQVRPRQIFTRTLKRCSQMCTFWSQSRAPLFSSCLHIMHIKGHKGSAACLLVRSNQFTKSN